MTAYYNEFNPESAAMLRQLIKDGHIAKGDVDERSITEVTPDDLKPYTQCHFFAGIGGWSMALRLAGWPDDRPVWTGSAPCQPFSSAGKRKGKDDDRHLFPVWLNLIRECRPTSIFGEQVASAVAHGWLDDVYQGLESEGYAVGAAVLPACSVGAPHRRDRLWFVGDAEYDGHASTAQQGGNGAPIQHNAQGENSASELAGTGYPGDVAHAESNGSGQGHPDTGRCHEGVSEGKISKLIDSRTGIVANATNAGLSERRIEPLAGYEKKPESQRCGGFCDWDSGEWITCPDQKNRLIEPSICLLADGVQHRRPILHGLGNAIVPEVAAEFIKATMKGK